MAKVVAPLFGFSASGAIAKTIIYMSWKGINDVRQYVIPANPQSTDQTAQRAKLTAAVAAWHSTNLTGADKTSWDRLATTLAETMSGFNAFCKRHIEQAILSKTWQELFDIACDDATAAAMDFSVDSADETTVPTFNWGYSKTAMIYSETPAFGATKWEVTLSEAVTAGDKIYTTWIQEPTGKYGRTGILETVAT